MTVIIGSFFSVHVLVRDLFIRLIIWIGVGLFSPYVFSYRIFQSINKLCSFRNSVEISVKICKVKYLYLEFVKEFFPSSN